MKKTIWKFQFEVNDKVTFMMPKEAEVLSVQTQNDIPCFWVLVDPKNSAEARHFEIFGTGHPINYDMGIDRKFIGTFQLMAGSLVFHVFERIDYH